MLAHQPPDLFGIDEMAAVAELGAEAAVAVALEDICDHPISATVSVSDSLGLGA
jgi:hypothetical protein